MVHDVAITESDVVVTLAFGKRRDPLAEYLIGSARAALIRHLPSSVKSEVKTVVVDVSRRIFKVRSEKQRRMENSYSYSMEKVR